MWLADAVEAWASLEAAGWELTTLPDLAVDLVVTDRPELVRGAARFGCCPALVRDGLATVDGLVVSPSHLARALELGSQVAVLATESHYLAHLAPIWLALPDQARGPVRVLPGMVREAAAMGLVACAWRPGDPLTGRLGLVASHGDLVRARPYLPVVYAEHGAGQSYGHRHPSYAGGRDRSGVVRFLVPGPHAAARNRKAYPAVPVTEIGCPRLDAWLQRPRPTGEPVLAVSFHWDCRAAPEAAATWSYWLPAVAQLARSMRVLGHGHPRAWSYLRQRWLELGVEPVQSWEEVLARATCYAVDNSSTGFEWAALGRPLVWLNAPWYRREVEHGLRFWSAAGTGIQCDDPRDLQLTVERALEEWPHLVHRQALAIGAVYSHLDGSSAERAARAIMEHLEGLDATSR